ncbi:hypothetical protein [Robinsoniella peoriensis]|uniref:hypothetical protein n=1 Tax=Robinsoniella peoriensis TaxID=180332 RepID=UPI00159F214F|nr:hypothetical protein [Robinsoniella peoriensis]
MSDRNGSGGERHRGVTSGQVGPKHPKNAKAPGRHKAAQAHEMALSFTYDTISGA